MREITYSKHLICQKDNNSYKLINELNNICIKTSIDLIKLMHYIKKNDYSDKISEDNSSIKRLFEIDFLLYINSESEIDNKILNKIAIECSKIIKKNFIKDLIINCIMDYGNEEILVFFEPIYEIYNNLINDLSMINIVKKNELNICFLNQLDFRKLMNTHNLPENIYAFVSDKTVLIINYEFFFESKNSKAFYPTLRHELLHIILAENKFHMPFWLEEGICEIYSYRSTKENINNYLHNKPIINFVELNNKQLRNSGELQRLEGISNNFYECCCSFVYFIIDQVSSNLFWKIMYEIPLNQEVEEVLVKYLNKDLEILYQEWVASLN